MAVGFFSLKLPQPETQTDNTDCLILLVFSLQSVHSECKHQRLYRRIFSKPLSALSHTHTQHVVSD